MSRRAAAALLAAALLPAACQHRQYETRPRVAVVDGDPIVQMDAANKPPSLDDPRSVPYRQHTDPPFRNERVLGVASKSVPRMYPLGLLDSHDVVNDASDGVPFVVARCTLTDLAAVYDRRVAGRTLVFESSGALWRDMMVLRDRETGTLWTPATGRALFGPLAGEHLTGIPAPVTTAEAWEELYPATVCLETGDLTAVPLSQRLYASSSREGVAGGKTADARFKPKERILFVSDGSDAFAFSAAAIREAKTAVTTLAGAPLILEWDAGLRAPRAFRQIVAAREELPVIPIYWFALLQQFPAVRTLLPGPAPPPPPGPR